MKVKVNLFLEDETKQKIDEIARMTYRGKGDTIDWLVAEAYERLQAGQMQVGKGLSQVLGEETGQAENVELKGGKL